MDEIFDCAQLLKFQTALELDKAYSRDYWVRGRIRVRLFDENGKPVREDIPTSRLTELQVVGFKSGKAQNDKSGMQLTGKSV